MQALEAQGEKAVSGPVQRVDGPWIEPRLPTFRVYDLGLEEAFAVAPAWSLLPEEGSMLLNVRHYQYELSRKLKEISFLTGAQVSVADVEDHRLRAQPFGHGSLLEVPGSRLPKLSELLRAVHGDEAYDHLSRFGRLLVCIGDSASQHPLVAFVHGPLVKISEHVGVPIFRREPQGRFRSSSKVVVHILREAFIVQHVEDGVLTRTFRVSVPNLTAAL